MQPAIPASVRELHFALRKPSALIAGLRTELAVIPLRLYFTPRELIKAIVDCVQPKIEDTVCDPAAGTGGFLLAANQYVLDHYGSQLDKDQKKHLKKGFIHGAELVPNTARLCIMNLYLHGVDADPCPITSGVDSLASSPSTKHSIVLTNPPFGKKSSITIVNEEGKAEKEDMAYERQDFWTTTKNKQLNFLQHVKTLLKPGGRCAVVVPDMLPPRTTATQMAVLNSRRHCQMPKRNDRRNLFCMRIFVMRMHGRNLRDR